MTHPELLSWLNGFLAAKAKAPWSPEDFERVRMVLDDAQQAAKPKPAPAPIDPLAFKRALEQQPRQPGPFDKPPVHPIGPDRGPWLQSPVDLSPAHLDACPCNVCVAGRAELAVRTVAGIQP